MNSTPWLGLPAWRRGIVALCGGAALALVTAGCTKDAESKSLTGETAQAAKAAVAPAAIPAPSLPSPGATPAAAPEGAEAQANPAAADDSSYRIDVEAPATVASGAEGTVRVKVTPSSGWKMNHEYPTKLKVKAPDGVAVTKAELSKGDAERFDDAGATFAVQFKPGAAGEKSFQAKLKFAVCTDATCVPKSRELAWVVKVQ